MQSFAARQLCAAMRAHAVQPHRSTSHVSPQRSPGIPTHRPTKHTARISCSAATTSIADIAVQPVLKEDGSFGELPNLPGVYAIYDGEGTLQYIGISRRVALSVANHLQDLPELTKAAKVVTVANPTKETLTAAWKEWVEQAVAETGTIPPGNMPGERKWAAKKSQQQAKPEIRLTPGKGLDDLTCSLDQLISQVVTSNKVVAFIKGTRAEPQCGFSFRVVNILNEVASGDYEVVNVLDEVYNPGLREAIKSFSQWPTIPQLYVDGDFVGGCDIVEEMYNKGELQTMLRKQ